MATLIIHGIPLSTYVRTCRMACLEKGVPYELDPGDATVGRAKGHAALGLGAGHDPRRRAHV